MSTIELRNAVALIAAFLLVLLPTQSKTLSQEQQVRGRVINEAFRFAVTIPPGRTATRVQHITSDAKTLFFSVSLPKPVNIDIYAERDPEHDEEFDAKIRDYIALLRKSGGTDIVCSSPQHVSLGSLPGSKYRIHLVEPDGKPTDVIWIGGKRRPQKQDNHVITVSVSLGGSSSDVAEYESELDAVVRSFEWLD